MAQPEVPLHITVDDDGAVAMVRLAGELDVATAADFRNCLTELHLAGQRRFIVDLSEVDFMDSTAIGVLVAATKRFRASDGDVAVAAPSDRVRRVLELTSLDKFLVIS